jgi:hypothetical protein
LEIRYVHTFPPTTHNHTVTRVSSLVLILLASALLLAACSPSTMAKDPAQPYAGLQGRPIKALAPDRVADLLAGRGASYALAAELNSYPGPRHVLDLASELALAPEQRRAAEEAYAAMLAEAAPLGRQLVDREAALDRAFADRSVTPEGLASLTAEIAALDGALRAVHLRTHLVMRETLTPTQVAQYERLRGYAGDAKSPAASHGGH